MKSNTSFKLQNNDELISIAIELGALKISGLSNTEEKLVAKRVPPVVDKKTLDSIRSAIKAGNDPLGEAYSTINSAAERRTKGAVYTPQPIVDSMLRWSKARSQPSRIIDAGTGSGRFLLSAGRVFERSKLIGFESDPVAAIIARANLAVAGFTKRASIQLVDYRSAVLPEVKGQTLFLGNPPYVRHHLIDGKWKMWLTTAARDLGYTASGLSGLHVYFFLATARLAKPGDIGIFITASEWMDVNYGQLVRDLLINDLGATDLLIIEPDAEPFSGTATTAVISGFRIGETQEAIAVRRIADLTDLGSLAPERKVHRERFETAKRWTPLTRSLLTRRTDFIELGELCRVHRGQVTGANKVWISNDESTNLPDSVLYPTVTKARELFAAGEALKDASSLRTVIDIPTDLDELDADEKERVQGYLRFAKAHGANEGYVATHRRAWWSVGLKSPAPILATYMARRPPAFVRNLVHARHINIAHGLYPREELNGRVLNRLASFLSQSVSVTEGRTYAGGLTKFEPREMERLLVPCLTILKTDVSVEELLV